MRVIDRAWRCLMDRCISLSYKARHRATRKTPRTNRNKSRLRTITTSYSWGRGTLIVSETIPRMKPSFPNDYTVTFYRPTSYLYEYTTNSQQHDTYEYHMCFYPYVHTCTTTTAVAASFNAYSTPWCDAATTGLT